MPVALARAPARSRLFRHRLLRARQGSASGSGHRWRWLRRLLGLLIVAAFLALLVAGARDVDWAATGRALRAFEATTVFGGLALALLGQAVASSYELLGRQYERHRLSIATTTLIGFVGYAFAMNLGAMLGGWLVRFRLYLRRGLAPQGIARIIGVGVLTNWSGYLLLGGLLFSLQPPALPPDWPLQSDLLRLLGLGLLGLFAGYLYLCVRHPGRRWRLRGVTLRCPSSGFALGQTAISGLNWLLMAAVIDCFLPDAVAYREVLAVLFLSSVAGIVVRVPAGLGVVEAVFVALLGHRVGSPAVLAAMVAFRTCYYLLPFLGALLIYVPLEVMARHRRENPAPEPAADSGSRLLGDC